MTEVWLRGPLPQIPALLQPVAHALLQAKEEVNELMKDVPDALLWQRPAGVAAPGFHLQHMSGVLDRLFTYAHGAGLSAAQLAYLEQEGKQQQPLLTTQQLLLQFNGQVTKALAVLAQADAATLTAHRAVGRAGLPSTVLGLYVHAAEHTMRHLGQLLVTVRVLLDGTQAASGH